MACGAEEFFVGQVIARAEVVMEIALATGGNPGKVTGWTEPVFTECVVDCEEECPNKAGHTWNKDAPDSTSSAAIPSALT
jgi:hypothetical protein